MYHESGFYAAFVFVFPLVVVVAFFVVLGSASVFAVFVVVVFVVFVVVVFVEGGGREEVRRESFRPVECVERLGVEVRDAAGVFPMAGAGFFGDVAEEALLISELITDLTMDFFGAASPSAFLAGAAAVFAGLAVVVVAGAFFAGAGDFVVAEVVFVVVVFAGALPVAGDLAGVEEEDEGVLGRLTGAALGEPVAGFAGVLEVVVFVVEDFVVVGVFAVVVLVVEDFPEGVLGRFVESALVLSVLSVFFVVVLVFVVVVLGSFFGFGRATSVT